VIIRAEHVRLRRFAYALVGGDAVDDVLQTAYLNAFRAWPRFRHGEGAVQGWLFRIVHREALAELRDRRHRPVAAINDVEAAGTFTQTIERRRVVDRALARLTPEHRAVLMLVDAEGYSYREASKICDIPEGTVASRLSHARREMRALLAPHLREGGLVG
jgi:RNA polymerase sigma-70 factor, ECF subfamily